MDRQPIEPEVHSDVLHQNETANTAAGPVQMIVQRIFKANSLDAHFVLIVVGTAILAVVLSFTILRRALRAATGVISRGRHTNLLIGLPSSGKTALFSRLIHANEVETRTSMRPNIGSLRDADGVEHTDLVLVDYPGHPRLRNALFDHLSEARSLLVVINAVTVQDDQGEGVAALADLLLAVLQSPQFVGVHRLAFVCTRRDELTSYSAKAVRKLLCAAMARAITSKQGDLSTVDAVVDSTGALVSDKRKKVKSSLPQYSLGVEEDGSFDFEQLGIPVSFMEVSCYPNAAEHQFSAEPLRDFISGRKGESS